MPQVRTTTPRLTQKQIRFLDAYAKCRNGKDAAISVGYTASSAPQMAQRTLKNPKAQEYLASLQSESRAIAAYDLSVAMQESLDVIAHAKLTNNSMAYFKAVEHRAKLSGLLIDRVQVATVDIKSALEEARQRTIEAFPSLQLPNYVSAVLDTQPNKTEQGGVPGGVGAESVGALSGAGPFPSTVSGSVEASGTEPTNR
jgi:Terminase small subunit